MEAEPLEERNMSFNNEMFPQSIQNERYESKLSLRKKKNFQ